MTVSPWSPRSVQHNCPGMECLLLFVEAFWCWSLNLWNQEVSRVKVPASWTKSWIYSHSHCNMIKKLTCVVYTLRLYTYPWRGRFVAKIWEWGSLLGSKVNVPDPSLRVWLMSEARLSVDPGPPRADRRDTMPHEIDWAQHTQRKCWEPSFLFTEDQAISWCKPMLLH